MNISTDKPFVEPEASLFILVSEKPGMFPCFQAYYKDNLGLLCEGTFIRIFDIVSFVREWGFVSLYHSKYSGFTAIVVQPENKKIYK